MVFFEKCEIAFGKVNYEAYRKEMNNKAWNGDALKDFEELPENVRNGWIKSAIVVLNEYLIYEGEYAD